MKMIFEYARNMLIWVVIIGIVFVFFSPVAHLEPSALRAARMASALLISFAISATAIAAASVPAGPLPLVLARSYEPPPISIVDLACARLC